MPMLGGNKNKEKSKFGCRECRCKSRVLPKKMSNYLVTVSNGEGFDWDSMILQEDDFQEIS
jgi:hypothetical protein